MPLDAGGTGERRRRRAAVARVFVLLVTSVLLLAFFRLQLLRSSEYSLQSEENRLRAITIPAPRGAIYDREGRVLAENVPGYTVSLLPGPADTVRAALERLSPYLDLGPEDREALMARYRRMPGVPLLVEDDAAFEAVSAIEERRPEFRRAVVEMRPRRRYPAGKTAAHVVGYVGEISQVELADSIFPGYGPGRIVGRSGVERRYEDRLSGEPGVRYVEVNALGSIVREFGPQRSTRPEPGRDLRLTLDLSLQAFADSVFPAGRRGGVVALDPGTGEVLALVSRPSFDPNAFVGGVDERVWTRLREDSDRPLLNRVSGATYSPGSTWKLLVAAEAMRRGEVEIDERMEIPCRGALRYGDRLFRCWREEGHGPLTLAEAIQRSCNVYFYQLGMRLGLEAMMEAADRLDFNRRTGLDLPHEQTGHFPTSRDWFDDRYGRRGWTESVVLNLAIGQGENSQPLIRQALFYAALATGEPPVVPHLLDGEELEERRVPWTLDLAEEDRGQLVEAMIRVVNEPEGTAYPWRLRRWTLAGKTGTAQNPHGEPHSWFLGFAPAEDPEILVAALVEFGHPDDETSLAVPVASSVVRRYLDSKHPEEGPDSGGATPDADDPAAGPPAPVREEGTEEQGGREP